MDRGCQFRVEKGGKVKEEGRRGRTYPELELFLSVGTGAARRGEAEAYTFVDRLSEVRGLRQLMVG